MDKICVGVPFYGAQEASWWAPLVAHVGTLHRQGIELGQLITSGAMATDHNRNSIVRDFLATDYEWLFWVDADTVVPAGAIRRLLDTGKDLVSGLYYGKVKPHPPIAYARTESGGYVPVDKVRAWERGEIIAVDAAGFGCMLTHRRVFEAIEKNYMVLQRFGGGLVPVRRDAVRGTVRKNNFGRSDGKVVNGVYQVRVIEPTVADLKFPFFVLEFGRTEDLMFFEMAKDVGYECWVDTSVECGHVYPSQAKGEDYRRVMGVSYE